MHVQTTTVEFTQEEIEIIGNALCQSITNTLKSFADKEVDIDDWIQDERALLYDLTNAGYQLWVNADNRCDILKGYHTIDVDKWIEVEKARALATTETPKKKK